MLLIALRWSATAQPSQAIDTSKEGIANITKWMDNLYEMGTDFRNDSFIVKEETMRLLKDTAYRNETYPAKYTWPKVIDFLNRMELKRAFWVLMNLYQTDTAHLKTVIGTFVAYDSTMDMSRILVSTFYTYAFADPRVCRIVNNHPSIYRPDIIEKEQKALKEMVNYVLYFRKQKRGIKN
jgi:hypothetical protein